jgi:hypothetical protein
MMNNPETNTLANPAMDSERVSCFLSGLGGVGGVGSRTVVFN